MAILVLMHLPQSVFYFLETVHSCDQCRDFSSKVIARWSSPEREEVDYPAKPFLKVKSLPVGVVQSNVHHAQDFSSSFTCVLSDMQ